MSRDVSKGGDDTILMSTGISFNSLSVISSHVYVSFVKFSDEFFGAEISQYHQR
jgi:hypothetical protein